LKTGVYVALEPELYAKLENYAKEMEWSKSQSLKKIIKIFFEEEGNGNNKKYRKVKRPKD
jgi:hypothetical protein